MSEAFTPPTLDEARKTVAYYFTYPTHWFCVSSLVADADWHWQLFIRVPQGKCVRSSRLDKPYTTPEEALADAWASYQKEVAHL